MYAALPQLSGSKKRTGVDSTVPCVAAWNGFNKTVVRNEVNFELAIIKFAICRFMIGDFGSSEGNVAYGAYDFWG